MVATLGRVIYDYRGLVETCQQRAIELEISRLEIDRLAGLSSGFSAKLLGNSDDKKKRKLMWPIGLEAILGTLGLKILLIEDTAATARTLALRTPVDPSNQRFGNKNNSKPSLKVENAEPAKIITVGEKLAAPQQAKPAPAGRAHLRVVQMKNRGRKYG